MPSAVWVFLDTFDDLFDLVDRSTIDTAPITPLGPVHPTRISRCISPFVPNTHTVVLKISNVGISFQEPQQLMDDAAQVKLLGGSQWKALLQIKPNMCSEDRQSTRTRTIRLRTSFLKNQP